MRISCCRNVLAGLTSPPKLATTEKSTLEFSPKRKPLSIRYPTNYLIVIQYNTRSGLYQAWGRFFFLSVRRREKKGNDSVLKNDLIKARIWVFPCADDQQYFFLTQIQVCITAPKIQARTDHITNKIKYFKKYDIKHPCREGRKRKRKKLPMFLLFIYKCLPHSPVRKYFLFSRKRTFFWLYWSIPL